MTRRRRILVVLADDIFVRNYLTTDSFRALQQEHDVRFVATEGLRLRQVVEREASFEGWIAVDPKIRKRHFLVFNILMWRHRGRSSSFAFRVKRFIALDQLHLVRTVRGRARLRALARFLRVVVRPSVWLAFVLGSRLLWGAAVRAVVAAMPVNPDLDRHITRLRPDLLVFPSSAYDPVGNDIARLGRQHSIRTLFLVDNWDNLSSKSLFWERPDVVGVWGPQSAEHAVRIQGFAPAQVVPIGTPRFDRYFALRDEEVPSPFSFPYVLFVGCALPFDEVQALRVLDDELQSAPERYDELHVVYRPHPWRQPRAAEEPFDERAFGRVVLDPQLRSGYGDGTPTMPDLHHYGPLLKHAQVVIAPLTTMLIEALVFAKPVVAIVYDDGVHYTSPRRAFAAYEHFRGLENVDDVILCDDPDHLIADFHTAWERRSSRPSFDVSDDAVRHFLHLDSRSYADRLRDLVDRSLVPVEMP